MSRNKRIFSIKNGLFLEKYKIQYGGTFMTKGIETYT